MTDQKPNAEIYKKMAAIMGDLTWIPKSGHNKQQNYKYATAEDVKDATRKAFAKQNLALLIELTDYEAVEFQSKGGAVGTKVRGNISYSLCCGDTGAVVTKTLPAEAQDFADKAFTKLFTTGLKYFLIDTFMISTGDEPDTDSTVEEPTAVQSQNGQQQPTKEGKPILTPQQERDAYITRLKPLEAALNVYEKNAGNTETELLEGWLKSAPLEELKNKGIDMKASLEQWKFLEEQQKSEPATEDEIPF